MCTWNDLFHSVADPGCFSIPDLTFFLPGSEFFPSPIHIKEFKYFNPKNSFLSSRKYVLGCSSRIRILIFYPSRILDPGVKKAPDPDPQHWFRRRPFTFLPDSDTVTNRARSVNGLVGLQQDLSRSLQGVFSTMNRR